MFHPPAEYTIELINLMRVQPQRHSVRPARRPRRCAREYHHAGFNVAFPIGDDMAVKLPLRKDSEIDVADISHAWLYFQIAPNCLHQLRRL